MRPIRINLLHVLSNEKIYRFLKMAEDNVNFIFGGETPQSDTKCQKLLECVLTGNSKLYLGKVYTEEQLKKLSEEEVKKLFIITKLSYQARW